jgi:hypothetical protein
MWLLLDHGDDFLRYMMMVCIWDFLQCFVNMQVTHGFYFGLLAMFVNI